MDKIDFVILWVDGSDEAWLKEKEKYSPETVSYGSGKNRFRDFDNLQYWFRGVEKYAPWVNYVYFVTWGHLPVWLNTDHPKLKVIKHTDYMPDKYLPTFNSNAIELTLNRLSELSEHFVLFNDDMFLISPTKPEDFFVNGVPCDEMLERVIRVSGKRYSIAHTHVNNMCIINDHFRKKEMVMKHPFKMINFKYGSEIFRAMFLLTERFYVGFRAPHLPQAHLKSTFDKLWEKEPDSLDKTCSNRFRSYYDVSHWLMRSWNLCENKFVPRSSKFGKFFTVSNNNQGIKNYIINQKGKTVCINDTMGQENDSFDFEAAKQDIITAFEKILPEKSMFEK